jgi:hypothetical protein
MKAKTRAIALFFFIVLVFNISTYGETSLKYLTRGIADSLYGNSTTNNYYNLTNITIINGTGGGNSSFNQTLTDAFYVPYTGASSNVNLNDKNISNVNYLLLSKPSATGSTSTNIKRGIEIINYTNSIVISDDGWNYSKLVFRSNNAHVPISDDQLYLSPQIYPDNWGTLTFKNVNGLVIISGSNIRFGASGAGFYGVYNGQVLAFVDVGGVPNFGRFTGSNTGTPVKLDVWGANAAAQAKNISLQLTGLNKGGVFLGAGETDKDQTVLIYGQNSNATFTLLEDENILNLSVGTLHINANASVYGNVYVNGTMYVSQTIDVEDVIYHSDVDTMLEPLAFYKEPSALLDEDGKIDHTAFEDIATITKVNEIVGYQKVIKTEQVCNDVVISTTSSYVCRDELNLLGEPICENVDNPIYKKVCKNITVTDNVPIYQEREIEGYSSSKLNARFYNSFYETKQELDKANAEIARIKECIKNAKDFIALKGCV